MRLLLASANTHKLEELQRALPSFEIASLVVELPAEDGQTYEENALAKARFARTQAPVSDWVVADDSGVEAVALGGRPGVRSARWSEAWVETMLSELAEEDDRRGRYVCVLAAVSPDGEEIVVRGELAGAFARSPRGDEGFGYDPIFVPTGETLTVAELGDAWKAGHSHRARAAHALARALEELGPARPQAPRT